MPKYLTDTGRDNDALNSAVGVLLTKKATPHASTQSILWDAIKDYAERAEERSPSHSSLVEENKRMREALEVAVMGLRWSITGVHQDGMPTLQRQIKIATEALGDTNA